MEKEFYTDEFEQLLKEKADQFRMYPSKRVWHSIYNNLHPDLFYNPQMKRHLHLTLHLYPNLYQSLLVMLGLKGFGP